MWRRRRWRNRPRRRRSWGACGAFLCVSAAVPVQQHRSWRHGSPTIEPQSSCWQNNTGCCPPQGAVRRSSDKTKARWWNQRVNAVTWWRPRDDRLLLMACWSPADRICWGTSNVRFPTFDSYPKFTDWSRTGTISSITQRRSWSRKPV